MATASQIQTVAAMSEAQVTAVAYLEAAEGDAERALAFAIEDLLRVEQDLAEMRRAVSHGYVRAGRPEQG
ncbi:hypothetical protein MMB17_11355 [Methylobacterium organophilum]|uniref:hypothetical protein n=1 Tax=Methylobacterium organophilum TaxID=410 RepID=UPI001F12F73C|nr:hypothetical protein [Methylobacterium organophilum]UMY19835.1 hypothetical protein MMB17_11355 [Methylobacterium organophilum]